MRHHWLIAMLLVVLALTVAACDLNVPADEEGPELPTMLPETGGEGLGTGTPEVAAGTATPEAETPTTLTESPLATGTAGPSEGTTTPAVTGGTSTPEATDGTATREPATGTGTATSEPATTGTATSAPATGTGLNEATYTATEYEFEGPASLPAGWTRFTLDNQGELAHDLQAIKLEDGRTVDDVRAALEGIAPPDWARLYGGVTAPAGERRSYVIRLDPGDYALVSFGDAQDGPSDAARGMILPFTVTGTAGAASDAGLPRADAEVEMADYEFIVDGEIEAGEQTLRVTNTGEELHELSIFRLKEGRTLADVQALFAAAMRGEELDEDELPMDLVSNTQLSPGLEAYVTQDFEPGRYVFLCFVPSPQNGMVPHVALGMIEEIVVE